MAQIVGMTVPFLRTNLYSGIIMSPLKHLPYKSKPLSARHNFKSLTLFCYTVVVLKTFAAPSVNSLTFLLFIFTDTVSFETSFLLHHRCLFLLAVSHARSTPVHFWHHFGLLSLGRPLLSCSQWWRHNRSSARAWMLPRRAAVHSSHRPPKHQPLLLKWRDENRHCWRE